MQTPCQQLSLFLEWDMYFSNINAISENLYCEFCNFMIFRLPSMITPCQQLTPFLARYSLVIEFIFNHNVIFNFQATIYEDSPTAGQGSFVHPTYSTLPPTATNPLTLIGMKEGTFHPLSNLEQILSIDLLNKISKLFWR